MQIGFKNFSTDSADNFRQLMNAVAYPGGTFELTRCDVPDGISSAAGSIILNLCDYTNCIYLAKSHHREEIIRWITFHTGAKITASDMCDFAIGEWSELKKVDNFKLGTAEYPDRSSTLIVDQSDIDFRHVYIQGPGIKIKKKCKLPEVDLFNENNNKFPIGLDFYFTNDQKIMVINRTTKVIGIKQ